jgi:hypothetical protein
MHRKTNSGELLEFSLKEETERPDDEEEQISYIGSESDPEEMTD